MDEPNKVADELESLVPGRVVADTKAYLRDWWPLLSISQEGGAEAIAAVRPQNVDEVARVVKYAASNKLRILARGGGSSVTGASVPHGEILIDVTGLNQVLDIDENNRTVTAQAGVKLGELEPKLTKMGFTLGQFPQSFELATIGGYISTMGTGHYSGKYGGIEDSVIRIQAVLPNGDVIWTRHRSTPRSSVTPDLSRLFIGAEGAFGVVTAAELRLHRSPRHTWKAAYVFDDFSTAVGSGKALMELDLKPTACRIYNEVEASIQFGIRKPVMILVYTFSSAPVMDVVAKEVTDTIGSGGLTGDQSIAEAWLDKRYAVREEADAVGKMGYMLDSVEIACRWSVVLEVYVDVVTSLASISGVSAVGATISHLYDQGACTDFSMILKPDVALYWDVWNALSQVAERHEATLSHHHGTGVLKAGLVRKEFPRGLLKLLKEGVDPSGTMGSRRAS
ncbi:MAG TPA: FAD-binding oxidoreductase [Nitrososphaerales archaeon]|nr:FAD-binding oxidoreductase [Nitrososphaerales archaeon]